MSTTINSQNIALQPKTEELKGELSELIHYQCAFCEKTVGLYPFQRHMCERLSGGTFYCPFCLRHGFNTKSNREVLIMSFRAIPGYYYYEMYLYAPNRKVWTTEIDDYIAAHAESGLMNPVFSYDRESMLWFVDFKKVGRGRKKIRLAEVMKTVSNILICFNLNQHIPGVKMAKLYAKYQEAIEKFYSQRYRPPDKRLLIPTLSGCGVYDTNKKFTLDNTRYFSSPKFMLSEK